MIKEEIDNINDSELIMLLHENDEDAKNILYIKYKFIIDILINKYRKTINALNIDIQEVYSECAVGFSDALYSYKEDMNTSLRTFITLCIERRIMTLIKKYNQEKYKNINDSYSLDYEYEDGRVLSDLLIDFNNDPLINITETEDYEKLIEDIKKILSNNEFEVFSLLIRNFGNQDISKILNISYKQVDNTIQRLKNKIKKEILNKN